MESDKINNLNNTIDLSIIVPVLNESNNIKIFYNELIKYCSDINYEIIFVDDGSTDDTLDIIKALAASYNNVKYISLSRNFGKEAAMVAGMQASKGNFVINSDVDLQDPLFLLKDMYNAVTKEGYDSAGAIRIGRKGEPFFKALCAKTFYKLLNLISNTKIKNNVRDFRLMNRKMTNAVLQLSERNRFSKGIFDWVGFKTKYFEYEYIKRADGEAKQSLFKLTTLALDAMISLSSSFLHFITLIGIIFFIIAILIFLFGVYKAITTGISSCSLPLILCIIFFCSGVQILCSGIIGEYIARIYTETKQRPIFIIRETNINDISN